MGRKQIIIFVILLGVLAALVYLQVRTWQKFDWHTFLLTVREIRWPSVLIAIVLVHGTYFFRALRWKIFLRPVKQTTMLRLAPAMIIGFTGLALLGRPGELIRPYLVARRENLSVSSQMAVWTVERIFDVASFTTLLAATIFLAPSLRALPYFAYLERAGIFLVFAVIGAGIAVFLLWRNGEAIAAFLERLLSRFSPRIGHAVGGRARAFTDGLHTVHDPLSFLQLYLISVAMWFTVALAYRQVAHAYPSLEWMGLAHVTLLMGFSIAGGVMQLPAVGGGAQAATIWALNRMFGLPPELAVSCSLMMWLVTFMTVTPTGLLLARREHVSLLQLEKASHAPEP